MSHEVFKVLYVLAIVAAVIGQVVFHRRLQPPTRHNTFFLLFGFILWQEDEDGYLGRPSALSLPSQGQPSGPEQSHPTALNVALPMVSTPHIFSS